MIDFPNIQNINQVARTANGQRVLPAKKEQQNPSVERIPSTDVIHISSEAAMKGRVGVFAAALANELNSLSPERIEKLKLEYAEDGCPVSSLHIADAVIARIKMEGFANE